jgi:zinc protease
MAAHHRASLAHLALLMLVGLIGSSHAAPSGARLPAIELREWRLGNGLHVVFAPHRQVPGVTVQVWYHVGSKNERRGIRGMAHLFEHMMFKGSEHVPPEQHARMISALGGSDNAFTAEDMTAYHQNVPRDYMGFAMRLEAERMRYLHLTQFTIASEREVVKEEKRMRLDNSPIGRTLEAIHALAFTKHPYSWTPAGDIGDLNKVTVEMCRRFYDTYYRPNNATLIVVGDVDAAAVRAATEKEFGKIPRGPEPPPVTAVEPPQTKERERTADWPSQLAVVLGAYHISAARAPDQPALKVVSALLSAGQSSRLNQALVRKGKLAVAAGGFAQALEQPGLFFIYAIGLPNHDLQKMKQALLDEVARLTREEPDAKELAKVKNQLATSAVSQLRTMDGLAQQIGRSIYLRGDARAFIVEAAEIDKVTGADVKRVAQRYLVPTNLSLILLPAAKGGGK